MIVTIRNAPAMSPGEKFHAEMNGRSLMANLQLIYGGAEETDLSWNTDVGISASLGYSMIAAEELQYTFYFGTPFRFSPANEPFRLRVEGVYAQISVDGVPHDCEVMGLGEAAAEVRTDSVFEPEDQVTIMVTTVHGVVSMDAHVIDCKPELEGSSVNVLSIKLKPSTRIDHAKWDRFLKSFSPL